jgi:hypothetical protein
MIEDFPEPGRWSESSPQGETSETAEHQIGAAFRRVREATLPSDTALARVARQVNALSASRTRGQLLWRLALAVPLIMATGGAVGAALNRWRRAKAEAVAAAVPHAANEHVVAKRSHRGGHRGPSAAVETSQPAEVERPAEEPVPEFPAELPPTEPVVGPPVAVVAPAAGPQAIAAVSAPARESQARAPERRAAEESVGAELIANAFRDLRSRGDASAALKSLDEYDRRFPGGVLRSESRVARVEALLTLDRRKEALLLLDSGGGVLTRDVRVTRGELRAGSNRCADAVRDFDAVLAARDGDAAGGRALYGRAGCRVRSGDVQAARRDLVRYLELHADGPSAVAARRALAALP